MFTKIKKFLKDEIAAGKCPYTKYSRGKRKTYDYTQHKYADGLHYHYNCVLKKLNNRIRDILSIYKCIENALGIFEHLYLEKCRAFFSPRH